MKKLILAIIALSFGLSTARSAEPDGEIAEDITLSATTDDQRVTFSVRENVIQSFYDRVCASPADNCDRIENYRARVATGEDYFVVELAHIDSDTPFVRSIGCIFSDGALNCARSDVHVMPGLKSE